MPSLEMSSFLSLLSACRLLGSKGRFTSQMVIVSFTSGKLWFWHRNTLRTVSFLLIWFQCSSMYQCVHSLFLCRRSFHISYICNLSCPYASLIIFLLNCGSLSLSGLGERESHRIFSFLWDILPNWNEFLGIYLLVSPLLNISLFLQLVHLLWVSFQWLQTGMKECISHGSWLPGTKVESGWLSRNGVY